ncbi:FkbM family methyltransferase [Pedobacter alpinus]|uniref:FkbM family methyltransferase n=1 Tax=Pedobacter alpinus TaxID=1590643 RepID=A0ABW5TP53_9SPHI
MDSGFLFRRLGFLVPCLLRLSGNASIKLNDKHKISSFQDVFLNPFYWDALFKINFVPKNIFDLGANFGLFSSLCNQVFAYKYEPQKIDYVLVEANKSLIKKLEENMSSLTPNCFYTIRHGAAGPKENIFFSADKKNLLASKISKNGIEVPFIDFNLLEKPELLKIDIEGAEDLLFENYFDWVKAAKAIIIEFHYDGEKLATHILKLSNAGFELQLDKLEESGYRNQLWVQKGF